LWRPPTQLVYIDNRHDKHVVKSLTRSECKNAIYSIFYWCISRSPVKQFWWCCRRVDARGDNQQAQQLCRYHLHHSVDASVLRQRAARRRQSVAMVTSRCVGISATGCRSVAGGTVRIGWEAETERAVYDSSRKSLTCLHHGSAS